MQNLSDVTLASDNVFGDDGGAMQLGTTTGSVTDGYNVELAVRVAAATTPTGGSAPGGTPPSGGPGGTPPTS